MNGILRKIAAMIPGLAVSVAAAPATDDVDRRWQAAYSARERYYQAAIGDFPNDILKLPHMTGVWPGGGLFVMRADKLGRDVWAYSTFGLSNVGMPAPVNRLAAAPPDDAAGYGFELMVVARENAEWPLWILQWATNAEILAEAGFMDRVEKHRGVTAAEVKVGPQPADSVNLLISKAQPPLPQGTRLPNGMMEMLIATVITDDEMNWSLSNGREALLKKLLAAGIGQISTRVRSSVLAGRY
ncbi:MAG: suppressor of fused domain protein [Pseudomonadota bacterium]